MLTKAQINYISFEVGRPTIINGTSVKGGEAQYDAVLNHPDALDRFRDYVKEEASKTADEILKKRYSRLENPKYRHKHAEAVSYKSSSFTGDPADYPFLAQEATKRSLSMRQVAERIISAANTYNDSAAKVEARRVEFNVAVDSAATLTEIDNLWNAAELAIGGL